MLVVISLALLLPLKPSEVRLLEQLPFEAT